MAQSLLDTRHTFSRTALSSAHSKIINVISTGRLLRFAIAKYVMVYCVEERVGQRI
jgi:hypothetical protein